MTHTTTDSMTEQQVDEALRHYGYDPEKVGYTSKAFASIGLENVKLRQRITELEADRNEIAGILNRCAIEHSGHIKQAERVGALAEKFRECGNLLVKTMVRAKQAEAQVWTPLPYGVSVDDYSEDYEIRQCYRRRPAQEETKP